MDKTFSWHFGVVITGFFTYYCLAIDRIDLLLPRKGLGDRKILRCLQLKKKVLAVEKRLGGKNTKVLAVEKKVLAVEKKLWRNESYL